MSKHIYFLLILFLLFTVHNIFCQGNDIIIQSGHIGSVNTLVLHPAKPLLFSAGEDGTVKVWNTKTLELIRSIRIFHRPVKEIAVHPLKPYFCVLEIKEPLSFALSVWNWETGGKKYTIDLKQAPLFFSFSTKGRFLIYGKPEYNSLSFHNAETGGQLSYFNEGSGIISYVVCSKTEKNIMTYQPSGRIMYWEIQSQKPLLAQPLASLPNLTSINVSQNKTFIAASSGDKLVIIDLLSGKTIAGHECKGILSISISPDGKEILCLSKEEGSAFLSRFAFNGKALVLNGKNTKDSSVHTLITLVYGDEYSYFASQDGRILFLKNQAGENTDFKVFSQNELVFISDIALTKKLIAIGNSEKILSFPLYFLDTDTPEIDGVQFSYEIFENKFHTDVGLSFYSTIKLISWSRNSEPAGFNIRNIKTGTIIEEFSEFSSPLIQLDLLDNGMITLERDGHCAIRDNITFQPRFEYTLKGLNKVIYVSDSMLVGARSKLSRFESSLISINPDTGEIVPLSDPSLLCYDLAYHNTSNSLYSLSIGSSSASVTQFKMHSGRGYEDEKVLFAFPGEDLSASLVAASSGDYIYTSLGYNHITAWDGENIISFPECPHIPRKLYVADKLLISLNRDQSVSIWDRYKRERMMDLYLFKDFDWVAVLPGNRYMTSENGEMYIKSKKE
ncbi:MAG: hypothetical protein JXB88_14335 [Spirochaetales bacterium]|nr:hypothetical protein [Spirochaetales bacterium]